MLLPNFYELPALSSQLSVFSKLCIMNTLLHFLLLLFQLCRSLRSIPLCGPYLRQIRSAYRGWLHMLTSSEGPLFILASFPPNPKPTTDHHISVTTVFACIFNCSVGYFREMLRLCAFLIHRQYTQRRNEEGKGGTIPLAPIHYGAAESLQGRRITAGGSEKSPQCHK